MPLIAASTSIGLVDIMGAHALENIKESIKLVITVRWRRFRNSAGKYCGWLGGWVAVTVIAAPAKAPRSNNELFRIRTPRSPHDRQRMGRFVIESSDFLQKAPEVRRL